MVDMPHTADGLTFCNVGFEGVSDNTLQELSLREVVLVESLLTPGLQTIIKYDSAPHVTEEPQNFEEFKGAIATVEVSRPLLADQGEPYTMTVVQRVSRMQDRKQINPRTQNFELYCIDDSILKDASTLVSKSWRCTTPTTIARQVLRNCANAKTINAEESAPNRDYIAENIHPFQVVTQQADVALAAGNDPSFVHFMTFENFAYGDPRGTHHFRSLKKMAQQEPSGYFITADSAMAGKYKSFTMYNNKKCYPVLTYEFPADFDLLQDYLNGVEGGGNSLIVYNPFLKSASLLGNQELNCGMGGMNGKEAWTNRGNPNLVGCPTNVEKYLHKRQARMGLLDDEDVALRLTIPWTPKLHAGQVIEFFMPSRKDPSKQVYGHGQYLISSLVHNIRSGGYSTVTLDCVSETVARGEL